MVHPLALDYGIIPGWVFLTILLSISGGFFTYELQKAIRLVMLGSPDNRFDSWGLRIKEVLVGWLGQKKVLQDKVVGTMHVLMFWGFLMLSTDMLDLVTASYFSHEIMPRFLLGPRNAMVEFGYFIAMIGCIAALLRRVAFTPEKLKGKSQFEGNLILVLILIITTTSYVIESGESPSNTEDFFSTEFIDSLSVVSLILFCENEFSIKFDEDDFQKNEFRTINGLTNIILDKLKIV